MSAYQSQWIWSPQYQQHFYTTQDEYGNVTYHWENAQASLARVDSVRGDQTIELVPENLRPDFITGTSGWVEPLDNTYFVRTGQDAKRFFTLGRVFAMLYSEAAGSTANVSVKDEAYSAIRFNEIVYSSIRRFVVVDVRQGFVYVCGIFTYSNRGTMKPGCEPSEHSVVHFAGTDPDSCYMTGESEAGLVKDPIEVIPADTTLVMKRESRIRFSKTIPVEKNVKVKDIGRVSHRHMTKLYTYWQQEFNKAAG